MNVSSAEAGPKVYLLHEALTLKPGMTATEYLGVVTRYQETEHSFPEAVVHAVPPAEFAETVFFGFTRLLQTSPIEELTRVRQELIHYGTDLRAQFGADKNDPDTNGYMDWMSRLRMLAGHSTEWRPKEYDIPRDGRYVINTKNDFWLPIYRESALPQPAQEQMQRFVFAEGVFIENTDTTFLVNLKKNIDKYGFEGAFFDAPFVQDAKRMRDGSAAIVSEIVNQAAVAGWQHASELKASMDVLSSLADANATNTIVRLGNVAASIINAKFFDGDNTRPYSPISETDPNGAPDAIKRIAEYIFVGERPPKDMSTQPPTEKSSVNYIHMSELAMRVLQQSIHLPEPHRQFQRRATDNPS